ncbi:MAG: hypothetical protein HRF50_04605 [Phycisphaerae bacterium]|jgi:hypothetical protein
MPDPDVRSVEYFERILSDTQVALSESRGRGDSNGELRILDSLLNDTLQYAVWYCDDAVSGVAFLRERGAPDVLRLALELNRQNLERLKRPPSAPVAVLDLVVGDEAHVALLLDEEPAARQAIEMSEAAREMGCIGRDKFWTAYADGLRALLERRPFQPPAFKLSGLQLSLEPYLRLMAALSSGQDPSDALRSVDEAFKKRQTDRRLRDWMMLSGDGKRPVRWDYRRAAILNGARSQT